MCKLRHGERRWSERWRWEGRREREGEGERRGRERETREREGERGGGREGEYYELSIPSDVESIVSLSHLVAMLCWLVLVAVVNRASPGWLLLSVASMYSRFSYAKAMV